MSSASLTGERWRLSTAQDESCLLCTRTDGPMVDCALDLDDGRRVYVCVDCTTRLAKVLRVGSKATAAVREELEAEVAERDQRLQALSEQLGQAEKLLAEQREETVRRGEALDQATVFASQAMGSLQQIGRLG